MSLKHIINKLNIAILLMGIPFTVIYYRNNGDFLSPLFFLSILLALSTIYNRTYKTGSNHGKNTVIKERTARKIQGEDIESVDSYVAQIHATLKSIKSLSREEKGLLLVSKYFENISDIEDAVSKLKESYQKSLEFLESRKDIVTKDELSELEVQIKKTKDNKKRTLYEKIYEGKKKTFDEIEEIKSALVENRLNLQYILSNLQQVEVTINSANLDKGAEDTEVKEVGNELETFSGELKNALREMHL